MPFRLIFSHGDDGAALEQFPNLPFLPNILPAPLQPARTADGQFLQLPVAVVRLIL